MNTQMKIRHISYMDTQDTYRTVLGKKIYRDLTNIPDTRISAKSKNVRVLDIINSMRFVQTLEGTYFRLHAVMADDNGKILFQVDKGKGNIRSSYLNGDDCSLDSIECVSNDIENLLTI